MVNFEKFTTKSGVNKIVYSVLAGFSVFSFGFLSALLVSPSIDIKTSTNAVTQTVGPHSLSMASEESAEINITPTSEQAIYSATNNLTISNTCSAGATVTMNTNGSNNSLFRTSGESDDLAKSIPATTGVSLDNTSWGYSLDSGTIWGAVPASTDAAKTIYNSTEASLDAIIPIMFGAKIDNTLPSGVYANDVVYTMTPKEGCLSYAVNWDLNGGTAATGAIYPTELNWGQSINLSSIKPTRTGFAFSGWNNELDTFSGNETSANINRNNNTTVTMTAEWTETAVNFDYTGGQQTYSIPYDGYYKLETWGAQGGYSYREGVDRYRGGYGAYAVGVINVAKGRTLYINIGGKGKRCAAWASGAPSGGAKWPQTCGNDGGYNGGGFTRQYYDTRTFYGSGGGATSISFTSGLLRNLSSQTSNILLIAAGGGGASFWGSGCANTEANPTQAICNGYDANGGNGGGISGVKSVINYTDRPTLTITCPTQTTAGTSDEGGQSSFGLGGNVSAYIGPGGGGGLYGGTVTETHSCGGSSYIGNGNLISGGGITKHMTCHSCETSTAAATRTYSSTNVLEGATSDYSKIGNGYARITYLGTSI